MGAEYSNPDVPHEVNVSEKSPVRDFLRLSIGLGAIVVVVSAAAFFTARLWAPLVPFRYEAALADAVVKKIDGEPPSACEMDARRALQTLADALAANMALPEGMTIRVHINSDEIPNAFATLGGNIVINRGLLENVHSENALAMVMAHEIGHIKHRDPIVSLGGGVVVAVLFSSAIGGSDGGTLAGWAIGLTQMSFSRSQEEEADREALAAMRAYYGHTGGADEFFAYIVEKYPELARMPAFASTHPAPPARLQTIRASFPPVPRPLKPMPQAIQCMFQPESPRP
jgi:predicted Zn-dependent protease